MDKYEFYENLIKQANLLKSEASSEHILTNLSDPEDPIKNCSSERWFLNNHELLFPDEVFYDLLYYIFLANNNFASIAEDLLNELKLLKSENKNQTNKIEKLVNEVINKNNRIDYLEKLVEVLR